MDVTSNNPDIIRAAERVRDHIPQGNCMIHKKVFLKQIRAGLQRLRDLIDDHCVPEVSWDSPFAEIKVSVPAYCIDGKLVIRTSISISTEDLVDNELPETRSEEIKENLLIAETLLTLTRGIVELDPVNGHPMYLVPPEVEAEIDKELAQNPEQSRGTLIDRRAAPITPGGEGNDLPTISFKVSGEEGRLVGEVIILVYPLRMTDDGDAWFSIGAGLVFFEGDPRIASPDLIDKLWNALIPPMATSQAPTTQPAPPRVIQDARVKIDAVAAHTVGFFGGIALWKKWDAVPAWEDLVQKEVQRIQEDLGDLAFSEDEYRDALLVRQYDRDGNESVHLTKAAVEELEERAGTRGFRRKEKDPDRVWREYLVKRVRAGSGNLTVKFSWYRGAELLSEGARERLAQKIREDMEADEQDLFGGDAEVRAIRENWLERLGTMNDAAVLAPRLLSLMYQQRSSRVTLPAWEGYLALGIENDRDHRARLRGAIYALMHLDFVYQGEGLGRGMDGGVRGSFVLEYAEEGQRGEDSDFVVHLSEWAVGSLRVFEKARGLSKMKNPVLAFDWQAKLTADQKKEVRYVRRFSALGSYYNRAQGLTAEQKRLMDWLEHELTLRRDKTAKGRTKLQVRPTAEDAEEPRIYRADFCPLLDPSKEYHSALGHFVRNAESGRKLKGRSQDPTKSGGARHGGLLEILGYELPPGRASQAREDMASAALRDLRAVVEEYLEGKVAGKLGDQWIDLQAAEELDTAVLLEKVSWFPFLPADWNEVRRRKFEEHHQRRFEAGERDRPVRVLPPRTLTPDEISKDPVGLDGLPLKMRLRGHRKRLRLSLEDAGKVFGVPKVRMYKWEKELDQGGAPIPDYWEPLLWAWIRDGKEPTEAELEEVNSRRKGGRK